MRYSGQNYGTSVALSLTDWAFGPENLLETIDRFESEHRRLYGYDIPGEIVELVLFTMTAVGVNEDPGLAPLPPGGSAAPIDERPVYFSEAGWVPTQDLPPRAVAAGRRIRSVRPSSRRPCPPPSCTPASGWTSTTTATC